MMDRSGRSHRSKIISFRCVESCEVKSPYGTTSCLRKPSADKSVTPSYARRSGGQACLRETLRKAGLPTRDASVGKQCRCAASNRKCSEAILLYYEKSCRMTSRHSGTPWKLKYSRDYENFFATDCRWTRI